MKTLSPMQIKRLCQPGDGTRVDSLHRRLSAARAGAIFVGMKLNSQQALAAGRRLYESYGGDWSKVQAAGDRRPDGVIDIRTAPPPPPPRMPAR